MKKIPYVDCMPVLFAITHTHTHTHSLVSEPVCDLAKIIMAKVPLMKDWLRNLLFEKHNLFEALLSVCVSAWHF